MYLNIFLDLTYILYQQYLSTAPSVTYEDDKRKLAPQNGSDVKPQYVHHVATNPPPEISHSIPPKKGESRALSINTNSKTVFLIQLPWTNFWKSL